MTGSRTDGGHVHSGSGSDQSDTLGITRCLSHTLHVRVDLTRQVSRVVDASDMRQFVSQVLDSMFYLMAQMMETVRDLMDRNETLLGNTLCCYHGYHHAKAHYCC